MWASPLCVASFVGKLPHLQPRMGRWWLLLPLGAGCVHPTVLNHCICNFSWGHFSGVCHANVACRHVARGPLDCSIGYGWYGCLEGEPWLLLAMFGHTSIIRLPFMDSYFYYILI